MPDKIKVSQRIKAIVNEVNADVLADIACDHAYISIWAVLNSNAQYSIACDLNVHSLVKAEKNIYNSGLRDKIEIRQANGLAGIQLNEADTAVIAGIGGRLCIEILDCDPEKTNSFNNFILQPQSEIDLVRRYLHKTGFRIINENVISECGIFYTIISAQRGNDVFYSDCEYIFGKIPIMKKCPALKEYVELEINKMNEIIKLLPDNKKTPDIDKKILLLNEARELLH